MYVILTYDIKVEDDGPKVLRNVFKICKRYLTHIQDSVFEGELSESQIMKLNIELKKYIRNDKDSIIIFKSRHERWLDKEFWGKREDKLANIF
ncbi:CRISPR-associated endonuclease Cas2 [Pelosinus sp. sgz500959]|uniref:CRISPR-associated endonuclease Cas2 n=1 Tax=Pelosinus sp. sgz500959 TaxID=3242472 RepID=UPI00366AF884